MMSWVIDGNYERVPNGAQENKTTRRQWHTLWKLVNEDESERKTLPMKVTMAEKREESDSEPVTGESGEASWKTEKRQKGGRTEEKVTCRNRKERKQPSFSPIRVGPMWHKDFFVVVLLDKGLLPWERRWWHHLNWLGFCPAKTKASSHPAGVEPFGVGGAAVCGYLCFLGIVSLSMCVY